MRRWHRPIPMSRLNEFDLPTTSGVYVLLSNERDISSIIKIAPARSLRQSFYRELMSDETHQPVYPKAMMYFETAYEAEEAQNFLEEFRRTRGKRPVLNSGF